MITQVQARSILTRSRTLDGWFLARHHMNLYRGCAHACAYCDGRAEKYRVEGIFGEDIQVKANALERLRVELPRVKERGFLFLGGGVSDAWQPAEATSRLARGVLEEVIRANGPPEGSLFAPPPHLAVHVLTKSTLVERDGDLLDRIPGSLVSVSLSTVDPDLAERVEPGCAPPEERIRMLERFKARGLGVGVMLMPVLPWLSDTEEALQATFDRLSQAGVDFVLFGGLTLKQGRQKDHFLALVDRCWPHLRPAYDALYARSSSWGEALPRYQEQVQARYLRLARACRLPGRIPHALYRDRLEPNHEASLLLSHVHEVLLMQGIRKEAWSRAARRVATLEEDVGRLAREGRLSTLPELGPTLTRVLTEWATTGRSLECERVLGWATGGGRE